MADTETEYAGPTILTKMTLKGMKCNPKLGAVADKPVALARIYGIARSLKNKVDQRGEAIQAIIGDFEGVNNATGETYRSGVLYLPSGLHDMVASALEGDEKTAVQFAIEVVSVKADNPIGYSYQARQLVKSDTADPLEALRNKMPQLPKPKAEASAASEKNAKK